MGIRGKVKELEGKVSREAIGRHLPLPPHSRLYKPKPQGKPTNPKKTTKNKRGKTTTKKHVVAKQHNAVEANKSKRKVNRFTRAPRRYLWNDRGRSI
ncbi:hypothetical protein Ddc_24553 [Ditylenchus destructor]|nr:hypothetical protein Ddc_24553 [Ditylenchus destructor]